MRFFLLSTVSAIAVFALACGSSKPRSGFDEDKSTQDPGAFGDGKDGFQGPAAKPVECAKAEAEAVRPPVDIIMAVDQSGSMNDDIANVKANINQLSTFLQKTGLDFRVVMIGTVGTGAYDVCVAPPLGGPGCASNGTLFRTVNTNVQSNDALDIILRTVVVPTGPTAWKDFLRPESIKVFIPITDDNAYSTAAAFDTQLLQKGAGLFGTASSRKYVFYPITGAAAFPSETTCGGNAVNNGKTYLDLAKLTKGQWFPICATNFAPVFEEIGKSIASQVACTLDIPEPGDNTEIDLGRVNVKVSDPSGTAQDILQDSSTDCDSANGWQYDSTQTKILLCGDACAAARGDTGTKVTVEFGCDTKVK